AAPTAVAAPAVPVLLPLPGLLESLDFVNPSRGVELGRHGWGVGCFRHTAIGCQPSIRVSPSDTGNHPPPATSNLARSLRARRHGNVENAGSRELGPPARRGGHSAT